MSAATPTQVVTSAPTFGGLSGYRRPAAGAPTGVPGGLPAFRGQRNTPGQPIGAPAIVASRNRQANQTNAVIPYARQVPLSMPGTWGRLRPGDVAFCSTKPMHKGAYEAIGYSTGRFVQLCGIDKLNEFLGGRVARDAEPNDLTPLQRQQARNWQIGSNATILLGGLSGNDAYYDPVGDNVADEWRSVPLLNQFRCDGVVLSDDQPGADMGSGANDSQLFNIAVSGVCTVNNGYIDYTGEGVPSDERCAIHDNRNYSSLPMSTSKRMYPMQMFDRDMKPSDQLYIGLVCTKRPLTLSWMLWLLSTSSDDGEKSTPDKPVLAATIRHGPFSRAPVDDRDPRVQTIFDLQRQAFEASKNMKTENDIDAKLKEAINATFGEAGKRPEHFYTFQYVPFSSKTVDEQYPDLGDGAPGPIAAKRRKLNTHHDDATDGMPFNWYASISRKDLESLVGAWRVGTVMDSAAMRMDNAGRALDKRSAVLANVSVSFMDWRALRNATVSKGPVIGKQIVESEGTKLVESETREIDGEPRYVKILQWPSIYKAYDLSYTATEAVTKGIADRMTVHKGNAPYNPEGDEITELEQYLKVRRREKQIFDNAAAAAAAAAAPAPPPPPQEGAVEEDEDGEDGEGEEDEDDSDDDEEEDRTINASAAAATLPPLPSVVPAAAAAAAGPGSVSGVVEATVMGGARGARRGREDARVSAGSGAASCFTDIFGGDSTASRTAAASADDSDSSASEPQAANKKTMRVRRQMR